MLKGKTILHIDDSDETLYLTRRILEADGAQVFTATSVESGMEIIRSQSPQLVLLDLVMSKESGFNLLESKEKTPLLTNVPIVVLSGNNDQASVMKAVALGAHDYLLKPFKNTLLLQKVRKAILDTHLLRMVFNPSFLPNVEITIPGEIYSITEAGLLLKAPCRIAPQTNVTLRSSFLEKIHFTDFPIRSGHHSGRYVEERQFINELHLIGVSGEHAKKLRNTLRGPEKK